MTRLLNLCFVWGLLGFAPVAFAQPVSASTTQDCQVLKVLYGNCSIQEGVAIAKYKFTASEALSGFSVDAGTTVNVRFAFKEAKTENGISKLYIVTEGWVDGHDCHACGALMGFGVVAKPGATWKKEAYNKEVASMGNYGEYTGSAKLIQVGSSKPLFEMSDSSSGQGYTNTYIELVGRTDGPYRVLTSEIISSGEDNGGTCTDDPAELKEMYDNATMHRCWSYNATTRYLPPTAKQSFPTLILTTKGTRYDDTNDKIVPHNKRMTYSFVEGMYSKISEQNL